MERRYDLLAEVGVRDITGYNAAYDRGDLTDGTASGRATPSGPTTGCRSSWSWWTSSTTS